MPCEVPNKTERRSSAAKIQVSRDTGIRGTCTSSRALVGQVTVSWELHDTQIGCLTCKEQVSVNTASMFVWSSHAVCTWCALVSAKKGVAVFIISFILGLFDY